MEALCQTGTVTEFIQEFEVSVAQVSGTKEVQLRGYLLAGLRSEERAKICPHKPKDLSSAIELAAEFEEAEKEGNPKGDFRRHQYRFQPKGGMKMCSVGGLATNTSTTPKVRIEH